LPDGPVRAQARQEMISKFESPNSALWDGPLIDNKGYGFGAYLSTNLKTSLSENGF